MPWIEPSSPGRLPSGRHGLPRQFVVHSQRERLLVAVAESVAERTYDGMTVGDVVARAGVSRRTFYELFGSKEAAVRAAYDAVLEQVANILLDALGGEGVLRARLRAATEALLATLAAEPAFTQLTFVEVVAAGPDGRAHHRRTVAAFASAIDRLRPATPLTPPPDTTWVVVAGIEQLIADRVLAGRTAELPALRGTIMYLLLLPWFGEVEARKELGADPPAQAPASPASADSRKSASDG